MVEGRMNYDSVEADLIHKAINGDRDALGELCRRSYNVVQRYCFGQVRNQQDAEDLVQTVFERAARGISRYVESGRPFKTWLLTIARNAVINFRRDAVATTELGPSITDNHAPDPEMVTARHIQIEHAFRNIPSSDRDLLVRRYIEGESIDDLRAGTDRSQGSMRSLLMRIRERIRNMNE